MGSPEPAEYVDITGRLDTVDEWRTTTAGIRDQLATALTNAGIDPLTVV